MGGQALSRSIPVVDVDFLSNDFGTGHKFPGDKNLKKNSI